GFALSKKAKSKKALSKKSLSKKSAAPAARSKPANKSAKRSSKPARAAAAKRKTSSARQDVPQFAPNFTVYVLPPDTVCLYSEDRKFFLHGEVYCALANVIGKGGKSFPEIAGQLARQFPPDQIEQALKRLMERGYLVPASPRSATDGYW